MPRFFAIWKGVYMRFFNVEDLIKESPTTRLFYIVGQRAVGKTYSVKRYVIKHYLETGKKFIYVRRWTTEINGRELLSVFSDVVDDAQIDFTQKYGDRFYTYHVLPKANVFYIVGENEEGALTWLDAIGRITCISKAEQFKGGAYNDADSIIFDEFITERGYIGKDKEPELFSKIVNTVGRAVNKDLKIFMLGNPDASIEANPYLYSLHLDYARLQPNSIYYYDAKDGAKTKAKHVLFIKLAHFDGEYLNTTTSNLFGTSEEEMSATGEVKTNKYVSFYKYIEAFNPVYELVVETPVISNERWHVRIYVYYGTLYNEPACYIASHHTYDVASLYCRYDKNDIRPRPSRQTYRVNIPADLPELKNVMRLVETNQFYLSDNDSVGTLYENIMLNS